VASDHSTDHPTGRPPGRRVNEHAGGRADGGTRDQLVRAGLELADELSLARLYAGLTARAVAERAGVTTGAFFHHFPTFADFADALALSFRAEHQDLSDDVTDMVDALEHERFADILRSILTSQWLLAVEAPELTRQFRGEMMLWSHHHQPLHAGADGFRTVGDVLAHTYRTRQDDAAAAWEQLLERTGLAFVEGFTAKRMATALTAFWQGLQIRRALEPAAVDDDLFPEVAALLTAAVVEGRGTLRPEDAGPGRGEAVARAFEAADLSPQARAGARRRRQTRRRIVDAATGRFTRGWEHVTFTEVAEWAGVSTQTVLNLFGSVRSVAAQTFRRHYGAYRDAMLARIDRDPAEALRSCLEVLARAAAEEPEPARALLSERLAAHARAGDDLPEGDIRVELPLVIVVVEPLERLGMDGARAVDVGSTLVNFTLTHAIPRPGRSGETAELALRLLPASPAD
jgi:AcrR family transcriptional regulator